MKEKQLEIFGDVLPLYSQLTTDYTLKRIQRKGQRYYYEIDDGKVTTYISATTVIRDALPTSSFLIDWIAQMGRKEAYKYMNERATFGTLLHIFCADYLIEGFVDLDKVETRVNIYGLDNEEDVSQVSIMEMKKAILSWGQFVFDYDVKAIAIELPLRSKKHGFASPLDLYCGMTIEIEGDCGEKYKSGKNKGKTKLTKKPKKIKAIIDVKSGKNFYPEHQVQLKMYELLFRENFKGKVLHKVYNWAPNDFRSAPTYKLKDQTDSVSMEKLRHIIAIAKIEDKMKDRTVTEVSGIITVGKPITNIKTQTMSDYVLEEYKKQGK